MRQIKFRGKRIDNNEWVYGSIAQSEANNKNGEPFMVSYIAPSIPVASEGGFELVKMNRVIPATVGQFTGLHDKHGREIYEGDIIKWLQVSHATRNVMEPPEDYIEECIDVVVFGAGAFTVEEEMYPDMAFICKEGHYNETDLFTWVCNLDDFPGITTDDMYICEVVGNIHDDPNLIEEGGQNGQTEI